MSYLNSAFNTQKWRKEKNNKEKDQNKMSISNRFVFQVLTYSFNLKSIWYLCFEHEIKNSLFKEIDFLKSGIIKR